VSSGPPPTFDVFLHGLQRLGGTSSVAPEARAFYEEVAGALTAMPAIDVAALSKLISVHPDWAAVLGLVVGLSQEQLQNTLRLRLGSATPAKVARTQPDELVKLLDQEFALISELHAQRSRQWSFADVLLERAGPRSRAGRAVTRGRALEDEVEKVVKALGLKYKLRTTFIGRGGRSAPCDVAIPDAPKGAMIVCAVKGFDATGSKLTDAVREVEAMADVRDPRQFVVALVDGMGWLSRQSDLRRIFKLWTDRSIDGLYSLARLDQFRADLTQAARIRGLL
jgi:hypothetical protein